MADHIVGEWEPTEAGIRRLRDFGLLEMAIEDGLLDGVDIPEEDS